MRRALAILFAVALSRVVEPSLAAAPPLGADGGRAGMCTAFDNLAFTFCVAFCEARECDRLPVTDETCRVIRRGFERVTGGETPPCSEPGLASMDRRLID